jgi:hypothetical protein
MVCCYTVGKKEELGWAWCMPTAPLIRKLMQEVCKFKDSLGYETRSCMEKKNVG